MMNTHTIDIMVTHLLQCSCNGVIESTKKCEDTALVLKTSPCTTNFTLPSDWNSILHRLLVSKCSTIITIPPFLVGSTWRETIGRKVLNPLPITQNCDNLLHSSNFLGTGMLVKRRFSIDDFSIASKRTKIEQPPSSRPKECRVLLKRTSVRNMYIEYKCRNTTSSVKLLDVLKEIPQIKQEEKPLVKSDFMLFLKLSSREDTAAEPQTLIKTSHPIKLVNYHQIPFSSDYGRRLLVRDRHVVSEDVILRKLDRTEWYLKPSPATTLKSRSAKSLPVEITFDKRTKRNHRYKFPKRQLHQHRQRCQRLKVGFLSSICRPVSVKVEQMDLDAAMIKARREKEQKFEVAATATTEGILESAELSLDDQLAKNEEFAIANYNGMNLLDIDSRHVISSSNCSDVFSGVNNEETIEKQPILICSCGEEICLMPLLECTKKPVGRKKIINNVMLRRSSRLVTDRSKK